QQRLAQTVAGIADGVAQYFGAPPGTAGITAGASGDAICLCGGPGHCGIAPAAGPPVWPACMPISRTCAAGTPSIRWPSISRGVSACSMARRMVAIHAVSTTATIAATSHTIGDLYQGSARTARGGTSIATGTFMSATLAHTIRIQPRGDGSRFLFAQAPAPRGHHTGSAVTNRCCYACEVAAVKPYIVRQVRCAELRNTPAIHSMTGDAHAGVTGSTGFDPRCGHLPSAQAHHVGNEIDDAFRAKRRAPRRHHPVAA